jgi:DNA-binding winged helix-turn-helix (wHTH) protein/tetratricopeptide (TPR) repeat protein
MSHIEPENEGVYRFGDILVEPSAHRLERDGQPLPLEPKAYMVLTVLLRHVGELVRKDELLDAAWGHHHVTPGVLNRAVSQLRHALGDSSEQPHYIATVHSLGFRFIGEVRYAPANADTASDPADARLPRLPDATAANDGLLTVVPEIPSATTRVWRHRTVKLTVLLLLPLLVLFATTVLYRARPVAAEAACGAPVLAVLPIELAPGSEALKPDMDGLADSLIEQLSTLPELDVLPAKQMVRLARPLADPHSIARSLGARLFVSGRLRPGAGAAMQLTMQLHSLDTPGIRWEHRYPIALATLSQTARRLGDDLRQELRPIPLTAFPHGANGRDDALISYLLAQHEGEKLKADAVQQSIQLLQKAVQADPGYVQAWCDLGGTYLDLAENGTFSMELALTRAEPAIRHGLQLNPSAADCHIALAYLDALQGDMGAAEQELRRTIMLAPDWQIGHHLLSSVQVAQGRPRDAMRELERAMQEHPQLQGLLWSKSRIATVLGEPHIARQAVATIRPISKVPNPYWFELPVEAEYGAPAHAANLALRIVQRDPGARAIALDLIVLYLRIGATEHTAHLLDQIGTVPLREYWMTRSWQYFANHDPAGAVRLLRDARPPPSLAMHHHVLLAQALALNGEREAALTEYRRTFAGGFAGGDPFLNFMNLELCLGQLANWAALLPGDTPERQDILAALQRQYARLRANGVAMPSFRYHEAVLSLLQGHRQAALEGLRRAIDLGFRDGLALRRDLAWQLLAGDREFLRQQQRLEQLLAIERSKLTPLPTP